MAERVHLGHTGLKPDTESQKKKKNYAEFLWFIFFLEDDINYANLFSLCSSMLINETVITEISQINIYFNRFSIALSRTAKKKKERKKIELKFWLSTSVVKCLDYACIK